MTTPARQPQGIPAGGQFAPDTHAEPDVALRIDPGATPPGTDMGQEEIRAWVSGQAQHHISPVIGWLRREAKDSDTTEYLTSFKHRVDLLAGDVAERFSATPPGLQQRTDATALAGEAIQNNLQPLFAEVADEAGSNSRLTSIRWQMAADAAADEIGKKVTAPAPVLDGFTAKQVEDYLAWEQHERQCACELKDDVCGTPEYGENWRWRMGVPDVEGIFDTIKDMAAAREAKQAYERDASGQK